MKEFIDKLIERLEEKRKFLENTYLLSKKSYEVKKDAVARINELGGAIQIVNELAEEYKNNKVYQLAMMYAKNIYVYGVDVTKEWVSAVQNHMALAKAYMRGRQDESDKFSGWREEHNVMIDGQYCWQTCSATEHCKECNRLCNGSIDYFENYDFMAEEYKDKSNDAWKEIYDKVCNLEKQYANNGNMESVNDCIRLENLLQYFKEELQTEEYNNGWIPCAKELPKKEISIRVWLSFTNQYASFTRRAWWHNNHFEWDNGKVLKETPLAWKPCVAPAPYTEGEAELYRAKSVDGEYQEYKGDWK